MTLHDGGGFLPYAFHHQVLNFGLPAVEGEILGSEYRYDNSGAVGHKLRMLM